MKMTLHEHNINLRLIEDKLPMHIARRPRVGLNVKLGPIDIIVHVIHLWRHLGSHFYTQYPESVHISLVRLSRTGIFKKQCFILLNLEHVSRVRWLSVCR